ncbi:hypothetical protein [Streptomyces violarus]|uniref:hypothetical protein n=1 Tax=Streptomyces violarus TaxID=67380 RepID=UPI0021BEA01D|nr:hypothetical protein [Streptomyces violarus]MCT9142417.1 hypothetical protein [Streptomyces violarus]
MDLPILALLIVIVGIPFLLVRAAREKRRPSNCSWCTRLSGHEVTGHSIEQCQGPWRR